jgi:hypothetical protein
MKYPFSPNSTTQPHLSLEASDTIRQKIMQSQEITGLSTRGERFREAGAVRDQTAAIWADAYHIDRNPGGTLNLGTSENYIMLDEIAKFAQENVRPFSNLVAE